MPTSITYPPGGGVTVDGMTVTVDWALKSPTFITRAVSAALRDRFISDYIFRPGNAEGGAVVYERVLGPSEKYPIRGDVQIIEPGDEFPLVEFGELERQSAIVDKYGAAVEITYEAIRRNRTDRIGDAITKLSNAILRKTDTRAMTALAADPAKLTAVAAAPWAQAGSDPFADLVTATGAVEGQELDYTIDTVLINPSDAAKLLKNRDIRDQLPREAAASNPLLTGRLDGLAGLSFLQTNRKTAGSIYLLQRGTAGVHANELDTYTRRIDQEENERWRILGARVSVPLITDPKSIIELTGI